MFKILQGSPQREYDKYFKECQKKKIVLVVIKQMKNHSIVRTDTDTCKCFFQTEDAEENEYKTKINKLAKKYCQYVISASWGRFSNIAIKNEYAEILAEDLYNLLMTLKDIDCDNCKKCKNKNNFY